LEVALERKRMVDPEWSEPCQSVNVSSIDHWQNPTLYTYSAAMDIALTPHNYNKLPSHYAKLNFNKHKILLIYSSRHDMVKFTSTELIHILAYFGRILCAKNSDMISSQDFFCFNLHLLTTTYDTNYATTALLNINNLK